MATPIKITNEGDPAFDKPISVRGYDPAEENPSAPIQVVECGESITLHAYETLEIHITEGDFPK